jgi:thiol-disulfide isomerase/thioredoxin
MNVTTIRLLIRITPVLLVLCLFLGLVAPGLSQVALDVDLRVVKYDGLKDAVLKNRGKVILIDFWGNYWPPCKKAFPHLVEMHKKYSKDGLVALSVSLDPLGEDPGTKDNVLKFLRAQGADFTNLLLDESIDFWEKKLRFSAPPCYYVFSRQGRWTMLQPENEGFDHKDVEKLVVVLLREKWLRPQTFQG